MSLADAFTRIAGLGPTWWPEPPEPSDQPVYDYRPLDGDTGDTWGIRAPRPADPLVFGTPLERHEVWPGDPAVVGTCRACGVRWAGLAKCWNCGGTG